MQLTFITSKFLSVLESIQIPIQQKHFRLDFIMLKEIFFHSVLKVLSTRNHRVFSFIELFFNYVFKKISTTLVKSIE